MHKVYEVDLILLFTDWIGLDLIGSANVDQGPTSIARTNLKVGHRSDAKVGRHRSAGKNCLGHAPTLFCL